MSVRIYGLVISEAEVMEKSGTSYVMSTWRDEDKPEVDSVVSFEIFEGTARDVDRVISAEERCQSEECMNEGVTDNGYCEECAFERAVAEGDALHDRLKEGD